MKKFLLSVALFGAFLSISTALVSCDDDYDDAKLTEQIASNKTAMETRLAALESAQSALQTAQTALPTVSDIETAKLAAIADAEVKIAALKAEVEDQITDAQAAAIADAEAKIATAKAEIIADLEGKIATAKEAAIAAADLADAAQLAIVQASIDALKTELTDLINTNSDLIASNKADTDAKLANIDVQLASLVGRITTLEGLVSDNTAAIEALGNALTALTNRVSTLEVAVAQNVTDIAANKALIEAQMVALEMYKGIVNARLDGLDSRLDGLDGDIVTINSKIDALLTRLATAETAITDITARVSATEATLNGISNADLTAMKDFLANWATTRTSISTEISDLGISLTATFRSLLNNLALAPTYYWKYLTFDAEEVVNDDAFGPAGEVVMPAIGDINAAFFADSLFFIANPSTVDWSKYELNFENSKGNVLSNVKFSTPESCNHIMTRANSSVSGIMKTTISFENSVISSDWISQIRKGPRFIMFMLTATDTEVNDGRKIHSGNELQLSPLTIDTSISHAVTVEPTVGIYEAAAVPTVDQIAHPILSNSNVWKKYISIKVGSSLPTGIVNGVDSIVSGNQEITLSTSDKTLANKTVTFVYHYLYMDGTRGSVDFTVTFTKMQYDEIQLVLTSTVSYVLPETEQIATSSTVLSDLQAIIPDVDAWLAGVSIIKVTDPTDTDVIPFIGTINFETSGAVSNSMIVPTLAEFAYTQSADNFTSFILNYSVYEITAVGRYGSTLTFYDALGNVINIVKIYVDVTAPSVSNFFNVISKVTNTWNAELNVNKVWAQLSLDSQTAIYNVNSSYNGDLTNVQFASTESDPGFDSFDVSNGSVFTINNPSSIAEHNEGLYPAKSMFSPFVGFVWAVTDNFDYKVLSPIKESIPAWKTGYVNHFTYTAGGAIAISHDDIVATDPSSSSEKMYFVGTAPVDRAAYLSATDRDWRIASVEFSIADPNASAGSSNVGLAELKIDILGTLTVVESVLNPVAFTINAKPQDGSYAVNPRDYTLNLVMKVTDVFGFTKVSTLDFVVDNGQ